MKTKIAIIVTVALLSFVTLGFSLIPGCDRSTDGGVFKSTDGGAKWEQKVYIDEENDLAKANVLSLKIDPNDSNVIYLGVEEAGIYKTTDAGQSWRQVLPVVANIHSIAIDKNDSNLVYASSFDANNGKVFKSPDGFEKTYEEILVEAQGGKALVDIIVDHYDSSILYAISENGGVFKSLDYGETWSAIHWHPGGFSKMKMSPNDSRVIYIGTWGAGLLKTVDGGANWETIAQMSSGGLNEYGEPEYLEQSPNVRDLVVHNSNDIFIATDNGLVKSKDGGRTWSRINLLVQPGTVPVSSLAIPASDPNTIYFIMGTTLHKSTNGGQTWANWLLPTARTIPILKVDPQDPSVIYAGVYKVKE